MISVKAKFFLFCFFSLVIVVALGALIFNSGGQRTTAANPMAKSKNIDMADRGLTLEERLGTDDNASLAFLYGADMMGSLDVCG
ncbi:MAG: hypothetical protein AB1489_33170 [Acidobacteriota bacterium]